MTKTATANKSSGAGAAASDKQYALGKWLSGTHKNTYIHNLNTEWIRSFSADDDFTTESYVVEWRVPPKPVKGWKVYDIQILEVSDDVGALKRLKQDLEEQNKDDGSGGSDSEHSRTPPRTNSLKSTPKRRPSTSSSELTNISSQDLQALFRLLHSTQLNAKGLDSLVTPRHDENQVKVGKCLSLSRASYVEANTVRSPSMMTMNLTRAAFSVRRLRRSTYAGQKRTINGTEIIKPGLKRYMKMKDIQTFVNQRFPHFTQSNFCNSVNCVTGKNVDKRKKQEYVEMSDSEEEEEMMSD